MGRIRQEHSHSATDQETPHFSTINASRQKVIKDAKLMISPTNVPENVELRVDRFRRWGMAATTGAMSVRHYDKAVSFTYLFVHS
jgi:hypothetical protein